MEHKEYPPLRQLLTVQGKLTRPVAVGTRFGTLPNQREFERHEAAKQMPYPPLSDDRPGCEFDPETRSLTATTLGIVHFTTDGILVEPCWQLSEDKTLLVLDVYHADSSGEALTSGRFMAAIPPEVQEIELDHEALRSALEEAQETRKLTPAVLARGELPQPGKDGRLELNFNAGQSAGTLREDGTMDFRERGGIHFVNEGDALGILHPPLPGTPGHDIFGNPIAPPEPKPALVTPGKGVKVTDNDDGSSTFNATQKGVAHYLNNVLEVSELLEIRGDVDYDSGNIRAEHGSVHIKGAVKAGFSVEATGDVVVDGLIEEADVNAGGLVVAGGVIMNGKNRIKATGNVSAKFFQGAMIVADGEVKADREISHCKIQATGSVTVTSGKGIISGGHVISGGDIRAKIIGNESRSRTIVEIRLPSPEQDEMMNRRNQLAEELGRLDSAIGSDDALTTLMTAPEEDRRILAELIKVRGSLQGEIRTVDDAIATKRREQQEQLAEKMIKADQRAYSGVEVILGGKRMKLTEGLDAPRFHWDHHKRQIVTD